MDLRIDNAGVKNNAKIAVAEIWDKNGKVLSQFKVTPKGESLTIARMWFKGVDVWLETKYLFLDYLNYYDCNGSFHRIRLPSKVKSVVIKWEEK